MGEPYLWRTANMSRWTCVVVKQMQSNPKHWRRPLAFAFDFLSSSFQSFQMKHVYSTIVWSTLSKPGRICCFDVHAPLSFIAISSTFLYLIETANILEELRKYKELILLVRSKLLHKIVSHLHKHNITIMMIEKCCLFVWHTFYV